MEYFILDNDINVYGIRAASFPDGVLAAHQQLHQLLPYSGERNYFGLSRPAQNGVIMYLAAAEACKSGELPANNLEHVLIRKGQYYFITIYDFRNNIPAIGNAFQQLIAEPGIDPEGYCIEWYLTQKDVRCMVLLKPTKEHADTKDSTNSLHHYPD